MFNLCSMRPISLIIRRGLGGGGLGIFAGALWVLNIFTQIFFPDTNPAGYRAVYVSCLGVFDRTQVTRYCW